MSSRVKPSSNRRMKGPIAQEALLSFAFDSSSAERPSKSRRLTSLPRVAPTISPRGSTISTTSGSGLFQVESDRTPIGAPLPTVERTGDLEKKIGRAHVCTPVTNAQLVCRLLLEQNRQQTQHNTTH